MSSAFLDEVTIDVAAGNGGRGAVTFRREKYVPLGGPDGGDGGHGGSVVLIADSGDTTLSAFRERRRYAAHNGGDGAKQLKSGRTADDLTLSVPPGTIITDADTNEVLADLTARGESIVVARGGQGGRGNAKFATPTRQAPRIGELGRHGQARRIHLELKLIADVGLVGYPNAGKSTLLAALTGARPKIAAYPFTTLHPNLGVAAFDDGRTLVIADVPGLIEGAHTGVGLGIDFLRHLERTRVLVHVVDMSGGKDAALQALAEVTGELRAFSPALADKPTILAFNKLDDPEARAAYEGIAAEHPGSFGIIAAAADAPCLELLDAARALVSDVRAAELAALPVVDPDAASHRHYVFEPRRRDAPVISREGEHFRVHHESTEKLVEITDMESDEAVARLQHRMAVVGIDKALAGAGCSEGDSVRIGEAEFTYSADGFA